MIDSVKKSALSAAGWGGLYGALGNMVNGNRSLPGILARGLGTAAASAPIAAGATYLGQKLLGSPGPDEGAAYTLRNALGGGLGGAALGGGMGYLLGSGKLRGLTKLPFAAKAAHVAEEALPLDNIIVDYLKKKALNPSPDAGIRSALMLGGLGGGYGALSGASEGSELDALRNLDQEDDDARRLSPPLRY